MSNPLVSVIMPAYNCERFIHKAMSSVLSQTYQELELLIADDSSKDNTKKIIDEFNDHRIKRSHNSVNQGYLKASNILLEKAQGDFIIFQDADDYCELNRVELLLNKLRSDTDLHAVGSNVKIVDENDRLISTSNFPTDHDAIYSDFSKYRNPIIGSALMFKKEILKTVGTYNSYFNRIGWEDYYWFSLIIQKYKVANLIEPLYFYRSNPSSVSNQNKHYKSVAGFETVVYYMNQRSKGLTDHIGVGNVEEANLMMGRFFISNCALQGKKAGIKTIFSIADNFTAFIKLLLFRSKQ
jgi:glycosyltransferase involved in cell wall biosynthesis